LQGRFSFMPFVRDIAEGDRAEVIYAEDESARTGDYLRFDEKSVQALIGAINSPKCCLESLVLGSTCDGMVLTQSAVLWKLVDECASKFINIDERVTQEAIARNPNKTLQMSCEKGYAGLLSKILYTMEGEVDINSCDPVTKMSPLMSACKQSNFTVVRLLLEKSQKKSMKIARLDLNLTCTKNRTAIMYCIGCHKSAVKHKVIVIDIDILRRILDYPRTANCVIDFNVRDYKGRTLISYLAERGGSHARDAMKLLFKKDRELAQMTSDRQKAGYEVSQQLRIDPTIPDIHGKTPLMYACQRGCFGIVKMLMKHKLKRFRESFQEYQTDDLGRQALHYAVLENRVKVVKYLLSLEGKKYPDINLRTSWEDGYSTPLMFAVVWDHIGILRHLLRREEIDVNITDLKGRTALIRGCRAGSAKAVRYLLKTTRRIDFSVRDVYDKGFWDYAVTPKVKAVLAYNIRNKEAKSKLRLTAKDHKSQEALCERVTLYTGFKDEFTVLALLKLLNNSPELVKAVYIRGGESWLDRVFDTEDNLSFRLRTLKMRSKPLNLSTSRATSPRRHISANTKHQSNLRSVNENEQMLDHVRDIVLRDIDYRRFTTRKF